MESEGWNRFNTSGGNHVLVGPFNETFHAVSFSVRQHPEGTARLCWEMACESAPVYLRQSADYIHTSRQIVVRVQEKVNEAICEGDPGYDEAELIEEYKAFLIKRGETASPLVNLIAKAGKNGPWIGGHWPVLGECADMEPDPDSKVGVKPDGAAQPSMSAEGHDGVEAPYFVSISRRTGFRRLHKTHCCGVLP